MKLRENLAISESGFVFDAGTGESFSLNPTGLEMIKMIQNGSSEMEICSLMMEKYNVSQQAFEKAFYEFLRTLRQYSLFES